MHDNSTRPVVRLDGYTRVLLTAIAVLLTVLVIGLWSDAAPSASPAVAQSVPKALNPNQALLDEQRKANKTLGQILEAIKDQKDQKDRKRSASVDLDPLVRAQRATTDAVRDLIVVVRQRQEKPAKPASTRPKGGGTDADKGK